LQTITFSLVGFLAGTDLKVEVGIVNVVEKGLLVESGFEVEIGSTVVERDSVVEIGLVVSVRPGGFS
jgi:hypothetical protein